MKFVEINGSNRAILFNALKNKKKKSWKEISSDLKRSKAMMFHYINGSFPIPLALYEEISKISGIKVSFDVIEKKKFMRKEVNVPRLDTGLAEILGALAGDGHISGISHEVSVTCSSELDRDYINHLKLLFERKLGLKFKISIQGGAIRLKTYSKELASILHREYGAPIGKKKGNLKIPKPLENDLGLMKVYIRGLFDTDGSVYLRRKKDIVVEIINVDKNYLESLKVVLNRLGFICGISGKNLYLYRKDMVKKFFEEIKPANPKHLKKYSMYSQMNASVV